MKCSFVLSLVLAVTSVSGQTWPNPLTNEVVPVQSTPLTHGPILGRPDAHSVRVWLRTREAGPFEVVYSTKPNLGDKPLTVAGNTFTNQDNTGYVDLTKLQANTRYYYGIKFGENIADTRVEFDRPWPSFVTLPDATSQADEKSNPAGLFNFAFSIGACQRQRSPKDTFGIYANPPSFLNLWKRHGDQIAFHVVNGDYTYEELLDGTRAGYENNYKLYLSRGRNVSNLLRYIPMMVMYDDHEVNSNTDGAGPSPDLATAITSCATPVWRYGITTPSGPTPIQPLGEGFVLARRKWLKEALC